MDSNHKQWNEEQQKLKRALASNNIQKAIELFLIQHAMVHSEKMSHSKLWSFEDEIWEGLSDATARCIPPNGEHSIVWIFFHLARIEDITMNMLVAGTPQLFLREGWSQKLKTTIQHSGNRMDERHVVRLSAAIDIDALRTYRSAVGRRMREIVKKLTLEKLKQKVDPARLQKVMDEGAVTPEAIEIVNYWGKRTIAGLLLMPPTRHNFLHLNEALRIKQQLEK